MTPKPFTITIHMVSSLDGKIAKPDNSIEWFETTDHYEKGVNGQDPEAFLKTIDCYVMGSRTYELALELSKNYGWAYGDTPTIVVSSRDLTIERPNVERYSGDLNKLVEERLKPNYRNVWVVGGALLVKAFIGLKLANEIRQTILPIILGEGKPFFEDIEQEQALHLKDVTAYKNGMIELCYEIKITHNTGKMNNSNNHDERIAKMTFASVYPHYVTKVEKKGRTKEELQQVIEWLTGYDEKKLQELIENKASFEVFFQQASLNPNAQLITGVICGYRVEEIENPLTQQVRYLDKLVDELAKGRKMEKILRIA